MRALALFCLVAASPGISLWAATQEQANAARDVLIGKLKKSCPAHTEKECQERVRRFEQIWAKQPPPTETRTEEGRLVTWSRHSPAGTNYEISILVTSHDEGTVRKAWIRAR